MDDRYLFRAKIIDSDKWVEGSHVYLNKIGGMVYGNKKVEHFIVQGDGAMIIVNPDTICQCTGLRDKNGKLIFENDIVRCGNLLVVIWSKTFGSWTLKAKEWVHSHFFGEACDSKDVEVIGNSFDNTELLEVRKWSGRKQ